MGALAEVNRSNWSKFVDGKPQFDPDEAEQAQEMPRVSYRIRAITANAAGLLG